MTDKKEDDPKELGHMPSSDSQTSRSELGPPDGGFQAWGTVFGCFGYVSSFGVYQDYYTRIYLTDHPPSAISQCHVDLRSVVRPRVVLSIDDCGVVAPIIVLVRVIPRKACIAVVSQHFSKRRTLVMSLVASGSPLGAMIHPIMLNHLLNGTVGFARGVRASAGFVSALLLIACLCMRTRELPVPTASYVVVARKCSREVLFILMTVGSTLFQIGFYFPLFFLQLDSTKHGIDITFSFYSLVIMNAACFVGRCTAGIIATYMGVLNFTIASTVACSAVIISMIALSDMTSVVVLGLAYGYFSGVYIALIVPLVTVFTPNLSELGARMGICFTFTAFGGLLGGPISGALLGSQYRWWITSLFSGLISLVGSLIFVVMRLVIYRRNKRKPSILGGDT
ncbi:major facilitator superfamily domain-containing protein [Suillus americanus]|nr:major facilitator superfamily domain-containing protein [Suillus americanus]